MASNEAKEQAEREKRSAERHKRGWMEGWRSDEIEGKAKPFVDEGEGGSGGGVRTRATDEAAVDRKVVAAASTPAVSTTTSSRSRPEVATVAVSGAYSFYSN